MNDDVGRKLYEENNEKWLKKRANLVFSYIFAFYH